MESSLYSVFPLFIIIFMLLFQIGISAVFVLVCRAICRSRGLPDSYMWFGLMGIVGIIVVAVISPPAPPFYYNPYYNRPPNQPPDHNYKYCPHCAAPNVASALNCHVCGRPFV